MFVDQGSLFIATGICAAALAMTMLSVWFHNQADHFMFGWMLGMLLLGTGVLIYSTLPPDRMEFVFVAFALETVGFIVVFIAARQFIRRKTPPWMVLTLLATLPPVLVPIALGYDGLGIMTYNFVAGGLLVATGAQYWNARAEAPSSISMMTALYGLAALSFFACGTILAHEAEWAAHRRPDNWAEQFNAIMCIVGITGIGALSLGLNQARAARRHREEARTDMLTGLLNRRALFDGMTGRKLRSDHAIVAFDLDRFKAINDLHGHGVGDEVLRRFAEAVRQNLRPGDLAARSGGEEFILVLPGASLQIATSTAERIRAIFAAGFFETPKGRHSATASAGVALVRDDDESFEDVLHRADAALYRAKEGGRNRVVTELHIAA